MLEYRKPAANGKATYRRLTTKKHPLSNFLVERKLILRSFFMKINFENKISRNINVDNQATSFFSFNSRKGSYYFGIFQN